MVNVVYTIDSEHEFVIAMFMFPKDALKWIDDNELENLRVQE